MKIRFLINSITGVVINRATLPFSETWKEQEVRASGGKISITENDEDMILALSFEKGGEA